MPTTHSNLAIGTAETDTKPDKPRNSRFFSKMLAKLPDHPAKRIDELLQWNWKPSQQADAVAA